MLQGDFLLASVCNVCLRKCKMILSCICITYTSINSSSTVSRFKSGHAQIVFLFSIMLSNDLAKSIAFEQNHVNYYVA